MALTQEQQEQLKAKRQEAGRRMLHTSDGELLLEWLEEKVARRLPAKTEVEALQAAGQAELVLFLRRLREGQA